MNQMNWNDNSRFRLGNGGRWCRRIRKKCLRRRFRMQNLSLLSSSRWATPRAPSSSRALTCTGGLVSLPCIISSAQYVCLYYRLSGALNPRISGIIRQSLHLLLCSWYWVCHESSLDILSFSHPLVIIQAIGRRKRLGVERVCGPSSTCLFLSSTLFVPSHNVQKCTCPFEEAGRFAS